MNHQSATANLLIDGLAICCFNKAKNKWEVGYLHPTHHMHQHQLILDITGGPRRDLSDASEIWIETLIGSTPNQSQYPLGFFDRGPITNRRRDPAAMSTDEKENFRWVLDLEDPHAVEHGKGHLVNPGYPVTRTFISDAVFYTKMLPLNEVYNLSINQDGTKLSDNDLKKLEFGRTNDVIGADITCAAIVITIVQEGRLPEILMPLVHRSGNPWQIKLMNMRPPLVALSHAASDHEEMSKSGDKHDNTGARTAAAPIEKGDFDLYYDAFELDDKRQKRALWGYPPPLAGDTGRADCNTVVAGTSGNLDALF